MSIRQAIAVLALMAGSAAAGAQQATQVQLKIEAANRTLTVSAEGEVSVDPDVAILHIGFTTLPVSAKDAYEQGAKTSNEIIDALKEAGIAETSIHSEWQRLNNVYDKPHKFTLEQQWTVRTTPARAAEILDIAIGAGANSSGQIDWTVADVQALEDQALDRATTRAMAEAAVLAKGMGVHLGALIYVTNQVSTPEFYPRAMEGLAENRMAAAPPLAIEPHKVSNSATVYAVFAID